MRLLAALLALALPAAAAAAQDPEQLPPPPRDPWTSRPAPPPPAAPAPRERAGRGAAADLTLGESAVAPAGAQAASLHPDEAVSPWRGALATGIAGKWGGMRIASDQPNPNVLLYFGAQADGLWTRGWGRAARLRLRMFTGGEDQLYVPSDGDLEAALAFGPREFRFVVGRIEVARHPALGIDTLAQAGTLPCFEGSVPLAGDTMRLAYFLSPVEAAWVYYASGAHIRHSAELATESDRVSAASAGRLRYTVLLPPGVVVSAQGDFMKMWDHPDLLLAAEGSLGFQALRRAALFDATVRWNGFTRRGKTAGASERESEVILLAVATLVL